MLLYMHHILHRRNNERKDITGNTQRSYYDVNHRLTMTRPDVLLRRDQMSYYDVTDVLL